MSDQGPNKATLRQILRSALASKRAGNDLTDAVIGLQNAMNALLAKMDADTGVTDTNYTATLAVAPIVD